MEEEELHMFVVSHCKSASVSKQFAKIKIMIK